MLGILINMIGPIIPLIASNLKIGLDYMGLVISVGSFALLATSLVIGYLVEFFGFKKVIFLGAVIIAAGCLGLFFSYSYILFMFFYTIFQFGIGILSISTLALVGDYYSEDTSKNILKANLGFTAGVIIAPLIATAIFFFDFSWQNIFIYFLAPQIVLIVFLFFLKIPKKVKSYNFKELFIINKKIISKTIIILCCIMALLYITTTQIFYTWFTSYFSNLGVKLHFSSLILAFYASALLTGMFVKNYLVRIINEKKLLMMGVILSLAFLIGAFFVSNIIIKVILIFLFGINIAGNFSLIFSISLNVGLKYTSTISGFLHGSAYIGTIIFQYISGYVSEYFSEDSVLYIIMGLLAALLLVIIFTMRHKEAK